MAARRRQVPPRADPARRDRPHRPLRPLPLARPPAPHAPLPAGAAPDDDRLRPPWPAHDRAGRAALGRPHRLSPAAPEGSRAARAAGLSEGVRARFTTDCLAGAPRQRAKSRPAGRPQPSGRGPRVPVRRSVALRRLAGDGTKHGAARPRVRTHRLVAGGGVRATCASLSSGGWPWSHPSSSSPLPSPRPSCPSSPDATSPWGSFRRHRSPGDRSVTRRRAPRRDWPRCWSSWPGPPRGEGLGSPTS